jgi:hypothetical protein
VPQPKRERTLYEISTSFFAVLVIVFALAGVAASTLGDGLDVVGLIASLVFLALGLGRLYVGLVRGEEGSQPPRGRTR